MSGRRVAVIGAGPAGLAAAWELSSAGALVEVYESRSVPGGRLRTAVVAGAPADVAVQLLSDGYDQTRSFLDDLGLAGRLARVPGRDAVLRRGRVHRLRYGSVTSMVASGALPAGLKLRLGLRYMPFLERHADVLDLNDPGRAAEAGLDGESIAEWGRRELGDDFVELLAYPTLAAYYGVTPEETGAGFFHALAAAGRHVEVLGVTGGFGPLAADAAATLVGRGVRFRYGAPVEAVGEVGPEVEVRVEGLARGYDAAVLAVPPSSASRLAPKAAVPAVATRSTATLVLPLDGSVAVDWFGLSIPRRESPGDVLAAVTVQSAKETGLGGAGEVLVLIPAPSVSGSWAEGDPEAVLSDALPALDQVIPGASRRVLEARLVRFPGQVFVPGPGAFRRTAREADTAPARVLFAGDYRVAPTVEGAVRSGRAAARRVLEAR